MSTTSSNNANQTTTTTTTADLAQLHRVSHKLAKAAPEQLSKILDLLLPRLLKRIGTNHANQKRNKEGGEDSALYQQIHSKLVEMLSDVMKRVRADSSCQLPCVAILDLLMDENNNKKLPTPNPHVDPFTLNLALAFLTMGVPRVTSESELWAVLLRSLALLPLHSGLASVSSPSRKMQSSQVAHLILHVMERVVSLSTTSLGGGGGGVDGDGGSSFQHKSKIPKVETPSSSTPTDSTSSIQDVQRLLTKNHDIAEALYGILLDALLYQPTASPTMPPPGLSSSGHERLIQGTLTTENVKDWRAEMLLKGRQTKFKSALLTLIAPTRRFALLLPIVLSSSMDDDDDEDSNIITSSSSLSISRTLALLVATSGDSHRDVAERASGYLRAYLDTLRGGASSSSSSTRSERGGDGLGNAMALTLSLLGLVLGQANAESVMQRAVSSDTTLPLLLLETAPAATTTTNNTQLVLSLKRRLCSESTATCILDFISSKILEENRLSLLRTIGDVGSDGVGGGDARKNNGKSDEALVRLSVQAASRFLTAQGGAGGSNSNTSAGPAAAKLLNILTAKLPQLSTTTTEMMMMTMDTTTTTTSFSTTFSQVLERILQLVCSVLGGTLHSTTVVSLNIRDSCYGTMSMLARGASNNNNGYLLPTKILFGGKNNNHETTTLLFDCVSREQETLRTRAVAALDALMTAYCRIYVHADNNKTNVVSATGAEGGVSEESAGTTTTTMEAVTANNNPWMSLPAATTTTTSSDTITTSDTLQGRKDNNDDDDKSLIAKNLLPILWNAATSRSNSQSTKATRMAAARWATELLLPLDPPSACHLLCFLSGDADSASIAQDGLSVKLGEPWDASYYHVVDKSSYNDNNNNNSSRLSFEEFISVVFSSMSDTSRPTFQDFSAIGKATAVRFGMMCLLGDLYGGDDTCVRSYVSALLETLSLFSSRDRNSTNSSVSRREYMDLLDECTLCLASLLGSSKFSRSLLLKKNEYYLYNLDDLQELALGANSSKARRYAAECCGNLFEDETVVVDGGITNALTTASSSNGGASTWTERSGVSKALASSASTLISLRSGGGGVQKVGEVHGAAFLSGRAIRAFRLLHDKHEKEPMAGDNSNSWKDSCSILEALGVGLAHVDDVVGNACASGISLALSYDSMYAPALDERLYDGCTSLLACVDRAIRKYGGTDDCDPQRASTLAEAAGVLLAATTSGAGSASGLGNARMKCVDALFYLIGSPANRKGPEIALVVGEALAKYADAYSSDSTWTGVVESWPAQFDEIVAEGMPPHQQVLYTLIRRESKSSTPQKRTATASALLGVIGRGVKMVNENKQQSSRPLVVELTTRVPEIQQCFITILGDPKTKQLARESSCLGLAACYGLAMSSGNSESKAEVNNRLLNAFGHTSNDGGSAMQESRSQNTERLRAENRESTASASLTEQFGMETAEVGGAAGLGEAALGAYREMAAASVALGRPDVLYALLLMSVSDPLWFSPGPRERYSAASLLGENSVVGVRTNTSELRAALQPHVAQLLPRLLRARYDPNKQTREQIEVLWVGLTGGGAEARSLVSQHFLPTFDALVKEAGSKLWRARVGACGALSEIISGRSWQELGGGPAILNDDDVAEKTSTNRTPAGVRLLRLWRTSIRALDDVRLAVRESGETLARSVRALTIRLCDHNYSDDSTGRRKQPSDETDTRLAASTSLRWLVSTGMEQPAAEAVGVAISTLIGIVEVVKPVTLEPVLADLIRALLMAMSGLEPDALNRLQVRAAGRSNNDYDTLERARLQVAQSGPLANALQKCLDMVPSVSLDTQQSLVSQFDSALRSAVGFATRAATADAVSSMCRLCPQAFKYTGKVGSANPTVRLLRSLFYASERERGAGAKDKMANALGNLAAISPGSAVRSLALRIHDRYTRSTGSNDDPAARRSAASALRAIAVRASAQFAEGGPRDVWCSKILPLAFLGMRDGDIKVSSLWREVWDEGGQVASSTTSGYGLVLEEQLLPGLIRVCVEALKDLSWSRRVTGAAAIIELCHRGILSPSVTEMEGEPRSKAPSKEELDREKVRADTSAQALMAAIEVMMRPRIWTGKGDVVKAAVAVAAKWCCLSSCQELAEVGPVSFETGNESNDLFVGDGWFVHERMQTDDESTVDDGKWTEPMDTDDEVPSKEDDSDLQADEETDADEKNMEEPKSDELTMRVSFVGLCRALLEQGFAVSGAIVSDDLLPYRMAALDGLCLLLRSLPQELGTKIKPVVYKHLSTPLRDAIDKYNGSSQESKPVLIAKSIETLAQTLWNNFGADGTDEAGSSAKQVLQLLCVADGGAWSVREAACRGVGQWVLVVNYKVLRSHSTHEQFLFPLIRRSQTDRKYVKVRIAGLGILKQLVVRAGVEDRTIRGTSSLSEEKQRILESVLPFKEEMLRICRESLSEEEDAAVTSLATDIVGRLAWWP